MSFHVTVELSKYADEIRWTSKFADNEPERGPIDSRRLLLN